MEDNYTSFDAYFHGRMSAKEAVDFQSALDASSKLKADYRAYVSIKRAAFDIQKNKLREQLESVDIAEDPATKEPQKGRAPTRVLTLLKSAAAIAALFIVGFWGYQAAQGPSTDQLFADNFEIYTPQNSRGDDTEPSSISRNEESSPESALTFASAILGDKNTDNIQEAIKALDNIPDESSFRNQKYWYLGLAHLKSGNIKKAKSHFSHLQEISNYKKPEIERILSTIRK